MPCLACGDTGEPVTQMTADGKRRACSKCLATVVQVDAPVAAPAQRRAAPAPRASAPLDPIKQIKARLRYLDGELKRLGKLEAEAAKLRQLLKAADGKPAAVVELKRSNG